MMSRAILWDMDGTLLDSEPAHAAAFADAVAGLGLKLPDGFHDTLLGLSSRDVHQALVTRVGLRLDLAEWTRCKWRHYRQHATGIRCRSPVADLARRLAARGVPMAVVSNSTAEEVALCLRLTGFDRIIPLHISRADVARGKPAPDGYLLAARRLGCTPTDCLVVEDSLVGARAGLAAGMQVLYHPQAPMADPAPLPDGTVYLSPQASPDMPVEQFLTTDTSREPLA